MDKICRLCTLKTPALTSVFSYKDDHLIADMISILCPIKIDPGDDYPKNICKGCVRIITEAYFLREKSLHSDYSFKIGVYSVKDTAKVLKQIETDDADSILQKLPEIANIKEERDPFKSTIEFVDENNDEKYAAEESESEDDNDDEEITPIEPKLKKSKYEQIEMDGMIKYQCPYCKRCFSYQTNLSRHIQTDHYGRKFKKPDNVDKSTSCKYCGAYISHKVNLKRHIQKHHPEHFQSTTKRYKKRISDLNDNSSALTKEFFNTPKKQKYKEHINIVSVDGDLFKYQCLLCNDVDKLWKQRISNGGTSNIRRHLSIMHPVEFKKFEADGSDE